MDDISIPTEFNGVEALQNIFNIYDEQIKQLHSKCCESEISTVKAQQDLYYCNLEIDQLYRTREVSEQEINNLTSQIATLKKKIKKLKWANKSRELYLTHWEDHTETEIDDLHKKISHLLECKTQLEIENEELFIICEEVTYLRKRIVDLTNEQNEVQRILTISNNLSYPKDISTDNTNTLYENMEEGYPDPRDGIQGILNCRINIGRNLQGIRGYLDRGQAES
jgi:chromosome segregation ATPase